MINLFQITSSSVRLVSSTSRELRHEWHAPADYSINVATANATQVNFYQNICLTPTFFCVLQLFSFLPRKPTLSNLSKISVTGSIGN